MSDFQEESSVVPGTTELCDGAFGMEVRRADLG